MKYIIREIQVLGLSSLFVKYLHFGPAMETLFLFISIPLSSFFLYKDKNGNVTLCRSTM